MGGSTREPTGLEIAVVGMAGRFPEARDVRTYWRNLCAGVDGIRFFSDEELLAADPLLDPELLKDPKYVKARGVLAEADLFDADLFGYNPREAELMDPQQRLFLECAWEALEDAGYDPRSRLGPVGVYGGMSLSTYVLRLLTASSRADFLELAIGNDKDYLATRTSYKLDLEGPSVTVQTACSTSLVTVHLACQGLLSGECDMALAGGASVGFPQNAGYLYNANGILSPDGLCRAFDAAAAGTSSGQGVGVVALKRLQDAVDDGDVVRAVILGSAVNNDGASKVGFTAPRIEGQARAIRSAQQIAEVEPESVAFVETHGTGTELGDAIEVAALNEVFRRGTSRSGFCALGAVKTNIGHLDAAAGIAGFVKAVLAVEHGQIPPNLHFESPHPGLALADSPFYVPTQLLPWPDGEVRRAGVSSFGLGGTNAHVVLEEAPAAESRPSSRRSHLLLFSARSDEALAAHLTDVAEHLAGANGLPLADVAYTTQAGRRHFSHRRFLVSGDTAAAARALGGGDAEQLLGAVRPVGAAERAPAFLLPGLGDHYPGMGWGLYRDEAVFRREIDACAELFEPHLEIDLRQAIYPEDVRREPGAEAPRDAGPDLRRMVRGTPGEPAGALRETRLAQPALFAVEVALARLLQSWGLAPRALLGYSLGEYTAACLAGVMTLEDAVRLVAERAKRIHELPAGAMLAVPLPEEEVRSLLGGELDLAAVNGPELCVASGDAEAIAALEARLAERGELCRRLATSHAFHSRAMAPVADDLRRILRSIDLAPPRIPYVSNVTGTWITDAQATDPEHWVEQLLGTVRFGDGVAELYREEGPLLLEVGPGQSLSSLARQLPPPGGTQSPVVLHSLPHALERQEEQRLLLRTLGELWLAGAEVSWKGFYAGEHRRRVSLPARPFERRRYWIEASPAAEGHPSGAAPATTGKLPQMEDWFYVPSWKRSPLPAVSLPAVPGDEASGPWWVLAGEHDLAGALVARLRDSGHEVLVVRPGPEFAVAEDGFRVDPGSRESYEALLEAAGAPPAHLLHLWTLTPPGEGRDAPELCERMQSLGFYSLILLAQTLGKHAALRISIVTNGFGEVERHDVVYPEKSTLTGPLRVIPLEHPGMVCRLVDLETEPSSEEVTARLLGELRSGSGEPVVAWRGPHRWTPSTEPLPLPEARGGGRFRQDGVYLVTGGLGGLGLGLAEHLARTRQARLVLVGRTALPPRPEWPRHLEGGGAVADRIRRVEAVEAAGGEVLICQADVTDAAAMRAALDEARERFGALHGVIHAAGVPGRGIVQLKTREAAAAVLAPKVEGTLVLERLLEGSDLDFFVLFSSLAAAVSHVGEVDYTAANAFLGAFASASRLPVVTVDWCEWQWDSWSAEGLADLGEEVRARVDEARAASGLTFEEGAEALDRILASGLSHVRVSTHLLDAHGQSESTISQLLEQIAEVRPEGQRHPRPALSTDYVAPRNASEEQVAALWEELLGVEKVGVFDDFFQLGGHSLLGTRLLSLLEERLGVSVALRSLFEGPTVAALAAVVAAGAAAGEDVVPLVRAEPAATETGEPRRFPLSFAQQRLWFLHQMDPTSPAYNTWSAARIEGRADVAALAAALREVVRRHDVLRVRFLADGEEPSQTIEPHWAPRVPEIDLSALPRDRREPEARRLAGREALRPFDLGTGRLLRVRALRLSPDALVFFFCLHHVVADGWSIAVFLYELSALYAAAAAGRTSPLPELPVQYPDYAVWQRRRLQGEVLEEQLAYWREHLRGAPPVLELDFDRPRPPVQSFRGGLRTSTLPAALTARLADLSRDLRLTSFMALVGGFSALLHRHSGSRDLVVGTPVANRTRRELEGMMGMFANTLALRFQMFGDGEFREHLEAVRTVVLGAYEHQELPFETLVEDLQPPRNLSHPPIFQVMVALQNNLASEGPPPADMVLTDFSIGVEAAPFDLTLELTETESGEVECAARYAADLFEATTVERLLGHFATLLESAAADPRRRLSELAMLRGAERHQLLGEWNDTAQGSGPERRLHDLFTAQAARTPEAVATAFAGAELTYRELDARTNQLARHLGALGVSSEDLVGVFMERSLEMIVALLGILKAGGAYVPLDPGYPEERLAFMARDAGLVAVLTQDHLVERLPETSASVLSLDGGWPEVARQDEDPLPPKTSGDGLAYMIYTSGSTGRPKGSMVSHRAIVNRLLWMSEVYALTAEDRVLQKTPTSFDVSVWELFWSLTRGACLVFAKPEGHKDSAYLVETIVSEAITVSHFVPSMLQVFLEEADVERCTGLACVVCSGEALSFELQRRFHERLGACLYNLYGPTEAAVDVTRWRCERQPRRSSVPIGRSVANTAIRVLDRHLGLVPAGVSGELMIGGVQVMRGYHRRPGLTAEKLVPDPFSEAPGARLYKTGDLSRLLPDGNVEYLGRLDHQVKIRGLRIELGEIEATLTRSPGIRQAAVLPEADGNRLVAYVAAEEVPTTDELRELLSSRLPDYMIPSFFVLLDELPLTPSGKADRLALARRGIEDAVTQESYVAPRTSLEEELAEVWRDLLGVDRIGVRDNFFHVGGHSLLTVRLSSKIRSRFGIEVPLAVFFAAPTVEELAKALEVTRWVGSEAGQETAEDVERFEI